MPQSCAAAGIDLTTITKNWTAHKAQSSVYKTLTQKTEVAEGLEMGSDSILPSQRLKPAEFQSPESLRVRWFRLHYRGLGTSCQEHFAVGGRKSKRRPPSPCPSWAELLAFRVHRGPLQRKPCTSKTVPRIKPGIDE